MELASSVEIPRLIDAAERLRDARAACRQFLMLHAVETQQPYEDLLHDLARPERRRRAESAHPAPATKNLQHRRDDPDD